VARGFDSSFLGPFACARSCRLASEPRQVSRLRRCFCPMLLFSLCHLASMTSTPSVHSRAGHTPDDQRTTLRRNINRMPIVRSTFSFSKGSRHARPRVSHPWCWQKTMSRRHVLIVSVVLPCIFAIRRAIGIPSPFAVAASGSLGDAAWLGRIVGAIVSVIFWFGLAYAQWKTNGRWGSACFSSLP